MIKFKKPYPNIIFAKDAATDISSLRYELSCAGIYFHTADFASAKEVLSSADLLVIMSRDYSSPAVSLLDTAAARTSKPPIIYIGNEYDVEQNVENVTVIPPAEASVISGMTRAVKESFGLDPSHARDEEIVCELAKPPQVYYNGTKLLLSKSEARIVHFLLTVESRMLVPKEIIGEYLALAPGAIPVHIHNINDKSMKAYHDKLIFSRSGRGYFVY